MRKYSNNRAERIADQIHKDIVMILRQRVKDPRVKWVTIHHVEVDKELAFAKIYWSVLDEAQQSAVAKALQSASGFIRSELAQGFKTYTIPQLKFIFDESLQRGMHILSVLDKVKSETPNNDD